MSDRPTAARDVPPGTPWIFPEHRSMAEVIRDGDGPPSDAQLRDGVVLFWPKWLRSIIRGDAP
jgi:hypothetical protein